MTLKQWYEQNKNKHENIVITYSERTARNVISLSPFKEGEPYLDKKVELVLQYRNCFGKIGELRRVSSTIDGANNLLKYFKEKHLTSVNQ